MLENIDINNNLLSNDILREYDYETDDELSYVTKINTSINSEVSEELVNRYDKMIPCVKYFIITIVIISAILLLLFFF